ncbi:DUF3341 domain-containing protein [bacterium]|nr:DUF3341 domain-containing protein [bacterium]
MSDATVKGKIVGALARFDDPAKLLTAAEHVRDAGYRDFDCHSPFPIHGMDDAMGEKRSMLPWIVAGMAFFGGGGALLMQWWMSAVDYQLVIAGKPFFSYQAFFPVTFGLAILFAAFGAVFGMIGLIKQRFHHPVFNSDNFGRFSDDAFFVSIEATDPNFDKEKVLDFLKTIGGLEVELLIEQNEELAVA